MAITPAELLVHDPEQLLFAEAIYISSETSITPDELRSKIQKAGGRTFYPTATPPPDQQVAYLAKLANGSLEGKVVLDAGCGGGATTLYAAAGNPTLYGHPRLVIGIDNHRENITAATKVAKQFKSKQTFHGIPVHFIQASFEKLSSIPDNSIDIIHEGVYLSGRVSSRDYSEFLRIIKDGGIASTTSLVENELHQAAKRRKMDIQVIVSNSIGLAYRVNKTN